MLGLERRAQLLQEASDLNKINYFLSWKCWGLNFMALVIPLPVHLDPFDGLFMQPPPVHISLEHLTCVLNSSAPLYYIEIWIDPLLCTFFRPHSYF